MVTRPKSIKVGEYREYLNRPLLLCEAFTKPRGLAITVSIRYDPWITHSCWNDRTFLKLSHGPFMLSKMHYKLLVFSAVCMKMPIKLTYGQFTEKLHEVMEHINLKDTFIINLTLNNRGTMSATIESANSLPNYFEGLLLHMSLVNSPNHRQYEKDIQGDPQDKPILVFFDGEPTVPCFATSLQLNNKLPYERALQRLEYLSKKEMNGEGKKHLSRNTLGSPSAVPLMYSPTQMVLCAGEWIPALFRGGHWYVPHVSGGAKNDALRMFLLESGIVAEATIKITDLQMNEDILLISAAKGIRRGVVIGIRPEVSYKYTRSPRLNLVAAAKARKRDRAAVRAEKKSRALVEGGRSPHLFTFKLPLV